ncbi:TetR/AcrR family transcriptional regulator [Nonomuraea sp. NPDC050478]|uniref:TetR/AcrR family transcriptional regulator n=1 Tax=Nonomuraea sp. NPDC050478 TaxID=3364365 RepID=UPI0037A4C147
MAKLVERPSSARGDRRREQLVDAGVALLCEGGWPAVTTRAVAERAMTKPGLIHYHFGGLPGLRTAIARRAGELIIGPLLDELLAAEDDRQALTVVQRLTSETAGDERMIRMGVELIAGAMRDPALGEVLRDELRRARERLGRRLGELHPDWSTGRRSGAATLVAALIDGLMLHRMLDPGLDTGEAMAAVEDLLSPQSETVRKEQHGHREEA